MAKSIAVAGKGGTGKTTIAALLVTQLGLRGWGPVLAVDADPDSNLGSLLGISPRQSIGDLREEVLKAIKELPAGMTKASYVEAGLHQIIEEAEGFDLLTMGRGEGAGCYCALNNMIRKFSDDLTPSYKWVIMDNEAGLEHLSRRTTEDTDLLLIISDPSARGILTAGRVNGIVDELGLRVKKRALIVNRVQGDSLPAGIKEVVEQQGLELVGTVPSDEKIFEFDLAAKPLVELPADSKAVKALYGILDSLNIP